ncbi:histone-lysine N-methyltransferase ATXR4-like [Telopea speciosissima]|uniref:histone-lysine N-methyltransferase ATXR4-like n=1 Tax=Telopea speciosissima TaxID=54955 RepID=UPI001CC5227B|nr:histone-lysine N-methyltransferase ATXR4-like [Telopea speciosissima]
MPPVVSYGRWALTLKTKKNQQCHHRMLRLLSHFAACNNNSPGQPSPPGPPPIQVSFTESAGRGVFATRRIGAGDLIHTAKPLVSHPSLSLLNKVCYFCLRKLPTAQSSDALTVPLCSDQCREHSKAFLEVEKRADWSPYNEYCRIQGLKYPLLVKRLACMIISGTTSSDTLDVLQPAYLSPEMISKMEEEFCLLRHALVNAGIKNEMMAFLTKEWYSGVLARIRINAFRIELVGGSYEDLLLSASASVEAEAAVGNAVYMLPSFYNHDCDPNVHIIWIENVDARLKALRDIEAGEELRICYIDVSMNHDARQELLFEGFGFRCNCLRCMSGD